MTTTGYGTAAVTETQPANEPSSRRRRNRDGRVFRTVVLLIAAVYFIGPLIAAISFTLRDPHGGITFSAYRQIFTTSATGQVGFTTALVYSIELSLITIVITLALMLPTQLLIRLRYPKVRGLVEVLTLLPLVFPPVVLVVGVDDTFSWIGQDKGSPLYSVVSWTRGASHPLILPLLYVMLSMPFVYRTLDAGIRAIDSRTLVEAGQNLGASWPTILVRVLVPSLRTAMINSAFLCFALVMGEFTIASILLYTKPFPVWLYQLPTTSGSVQAAVSVFSLLLVEVLLLLIGVLNWRRSSEKKG